MRTIEEIIETKEGIIAHTNDGRGYVLRDAGPRIDHNHADYKWVPLPSLPQDDYVDPIQKHIEEFKAFLPKLQESIGGELSQVMDMINGAILSSHMRTHHGHGDRPQSPDGEHDCPVTGCDYVGTVQEVVEHMKTTHPDRTTAG